MLGHFFLSASLSIILVLKLFPLFSTDFAVKLERNHTSVPLTVISFFFLTMIINGIVIEKILMRRNPKYKLYAVDNIVEKSDS